MNVHDLVTAAGMVGGDVGRAVPALVRVAVTATAMLADAENGVDSEALEEALRGLEAVLGPIPTPKESQPL